ncbi:hypothetical protein RhiirA1_473781 [Rhizophagus irregularis]|uniref:Uncharacterized protein n=1 Tax=Rhizophagus irregularis TaxID=588596 RepID=A0A2N0QZV4_9GLOM|nr:hypothetical protein RhiirA1_473781 [Rhizophagus irregularis]
MVRSKPTRVAKGKTKTAGTAPNRTEAAANRLKAARTAQNLDEMNNEDERINDEINDDEISFLGDLSKVREIEGEQERAIEEREIERERIKRRRNNEREKEQEYREKEQDDNYSDPPVPPQFELMTNKLQICNWLVNNPDILQLANQMLNMKDGTSQSAPAPVPPVHASLTPTNNDKYRLIDEEIKCLFLKSRFPPGHAFEKLVRKIFPELETYSSTAKSIIDRCRKSFSDYRYQLRITIEELIQEFQKEIQSTVLLPTEVNEFISPDIVIKRIFNRYFLAVDISELPEISMKITQLKRQKIFAVELKLNQIIEIENKLENETIKWQMYRKLQQQQQLINNLEQVEVSQELRIEDLERQRSQIRERLSRASRESTRNLQRALGAEGRIDDLNFEIRSLKSNK